MTKQIFETHPFDLVVAGAGIAGLTLAYALAQALGNGFKIAVVDPVGLRRSSPGRASALAPDSKRLLEQLGLWSNISPHVQAIQKMAITDSRLDDAIRPIYLDFDRLKDQEAIAYVVEDDYIFASLRSACKNVNISIFESSVETFTAHSLKTDILLKSGETLQSRLLVAADGAAGVLRAKAGIQTVSWDYDQSALVLTFKHQCDHEGIAEQHFLPGGPFGLLPLPQNRCSVVWTQSPRDSAKLATLREPELALELLKRIGHRFGDIVIESRPKSFPISLSIAREFTGKRFVVIGDAAHRMHPLAGQGLNFGFRDVATLAQSICDTYRLGLDYGSAGALAFYARSRRFDTLKMLTATDALYHLFRTQLLPVRLLRDLGLGLVNRSSALKRYFIQQASNEHSQVRLLQGEML